MVKYYFQISLVSLFYIIIQIKCSISLEDRAAERKEFSLERSCDNLLKLGNYVCEKDESGIFRLTFNDVKYLPPRAFQGLSIHFLVLKDPDVNVHEDVFDGIVELEEFKVEQSNIKVFYFIYLAKKSGVALIQFPLTLHYSRKIFCYQHYIHI